jgi:hypothetical protein
MTQKEGTEGEGRVMERQRRKQGLCCQTIHIK